MAFDGDSPSVERCRQYKNDKGLDDLCNAVKKEIDSYIAVFNSYLDKINLRHSKEAYLEFYALHYLGIYRPTGNSADASTIFSWDNDVKGQSEFDLTNTYDSAKPDKPTITTANFLKYLKFIYDYSYETWTIDYVIKILVEWGVPLENITINAQHKSKPITLEVKTTTEAVDIVAVLRGYADTIGLPPTSSLQFKLV